MSYFINICLICLNKSDNLLFIRSQNTNRTSIEDKLEYFLPEHDFNSNIPKYICGKCENSLNKSYKFKQKCLQNITAYEKYAQQITIEDSCKYLSVTIRPDFAYEEAEIDGNDSETNIIKPQTKIVQHEIDKLESSRMEIKEETSDNFISTGIENINENDNVKLESHIGLHDITPEKCQNDVKKEIKEETSETDDVYYNIIEENKNISEKLYMCEVCNKSFKFSQNLKKHQLTHTNEKPYTCKICRKSFRQLQHLKNHNLQHTGEKPFPCEACNKSFRRLHHLERHRVTHINEKLFTCEVCSESFRLSKVFEQHKLLHTGEKPYTCEDCNKSFRHLSNLRRHRLMHTDKKPYTCEVCNESFQQMQTLKLHKLLHPGEKPFTCEVCNKSFIQLSHLKRHRSTHTDEKPFTCEVCNKSFRQLHHLKEHYVSHTGERSFTCEICNKSFKRTQNLNKHKLVHKKTI